MVQTNCKLKLFYIQNKEIQTKSIKKKQENLKNAKVTQLAWKSTLERSKETHGWMQQKQTLRS